MSAGHPLGSDAQARPLTIVALGDSTTAVDDWSGQAIEVYAGLLPAALAACGIAARVHNAGITGTTTREARERLDRDVRSFSPDLVVIQFGINDSWVEVDLGRREPYMTRGEYRDNLRHIIGTLKADGAQVVLMTPNPMRWNDPVYIDAFQKNPGLLDTGSERGINGLLDPYAQDVRDVAREEAVPLVDVHRAFEEYGSRPGRSIHDLLMEGDGIHPNARGQWLVCELLAAEIAIMANEPMRRVRPAHVETADRVAERVHQRSAAAPAPTEGLTVHDTYERLADALDRLANGFPRTTEGVETRLLQKMFSLEEAAVAAALTATPQTSAVVAERSGAAPGRARALLKSMVERDLVWLSTTPGWRGYRLAPFVVGSYEAHMLTTRDPEFAALVEEYLTSGGAAAIMAPQPAIHRTVPARAAVKEEWVLPYDDVRQLLLEANAFRLEDCVCRVQQDQLDQRRCDFPIASCLWFSSGEPNAEQGTISRAEALAFLDSAEQIGLVHTVSNATTGAGYVCNCCGCCCGLLRGITEWGIEHSVAQANYFAVIDSDACSNCGTCVERCQVRAIAEADDVPVIDLALCIGCGLCVTGCDQHAVRLERKPPDEIVVPPIDFDAWERERLRNRGLL